jgi:hypothetical protein
MFSRLKSHANHTILGLILCASAGAAALGLASPVSASQAVPTITVTMRDNWSGINSVPPNFRYEFTNRPHYTLRVTGSNFVPNTTVRIALLDTVRWEVLAKGSTKAQPATTSELCDLDFTTCSRPNPRAGTFAYRVGLSSLPAPSHLEVLYRASGTTGIHEVTLQ